ncbi:hypothetical protein HYC85_005556 [Camellia sinensis]|uniref:Uncharacterized protein n=1 Tax=Camellia sinensis TaxID=4442 RepID=A0A7J7I1C8_CAMSI|nr:hypothetical protein HYC85_005556 [Camellia sinensis]
MENVKFPVVRIAVYKAIYPRLGTLTDVFAAIDQVKHFSPSIPLLENMTAFEIMGVAACNTNRTCTATLVLSNGQKLGGVGLSDYSFGMVETRINAENILEGRDPQYDAMLGQMAGRIRSKPGGKLEMGEIRGKTCSSRTLNVAQLRHIILLHQGKADDHNGHMDFTKIADMFRIDVVQIQKILQSVSLPPEDSSKERNIFQIIIAASTTASPPFTTIATANYHCHLRPPLPSPSPPQLPPSPPPHHHF